MSDRTADQRTVEQQCNHDWEAGSWGVILGISRCKKCRATARKEHFPSWRPFDHPDAGPRGDRYPYGDPQ